MEVIKESEINNELISSEEFSTRFIRQWPVAKVVLDDLSLVIKRPLIKTIIKIMVEVGDRIYQKKIKEFNITL